jgi:1,4-alpha-glucan branching enzyme
VEVLLKNHAPQYGGGGGGDLGAVEAVHEPMHGRPFSAAVTIPPLATVWLAPIG